jgi:hypothetical protein
MLRHSFRCLDLSRARASNKTWLWTASGQVITVRPGQRPAATNRDWHSRKIHADGRSSLRRKRRFCPKVINFIYNIDKIEYITTLKNHLL